MTPILVSFLILSVCANVVLYLRVCDTEEGWRETRRLLDATEKREVAAYEELDKLRRRLAPFKAYEDQVSR
jgi:hypothetical protein